jgi:hypothetical protein
MLVIFLVGSLTLGLALGQALRVFLLAPTSLLVAVLLLTAYLQQGQEMPRALLETGATVVLLQAGYFLGLALRFRPSWWWGLVRPTGPQRAQGQPHHS